MISLCLLALEERFTHRVPPPGMKESFRRYIYDSLLHSSAFCTVTATLFGSIPLRNARSSRTASKGSIFTSEDLFVHSREGAPSHTSSLAPVAPYRASPEGRRGLGPRRHTTHRLLGACIALPDSLPPVRARALRSPPSTTEAARSVPPHDAPEPRRQYASKWRLQSRQTHAPEGRCFPLHATVPQATLCRPDDGRPEGETSLPTRWHPPRS